MAHPRSIKRIYLVCVTGLRAIRLREAFIEMYKSTEHLTAEKLKMQGLTWNSIFVEIPICVQNSTLVQSFMLGLDRSGAMKRDDLNRLNLDVTHFIDQSLSFLGECVDDLMQEQKKVPSADRTAGVWDPGPVCR